MDAWRTGNEEGFSIFDLQLAIESEYRRSNSIENRELKIENHTMSTVNKVRGGFGLSLLILIVIGLAAYLNSTQLVSTAERVAHTHEVLASLETLLSQFQDAETGQRGYLLTSNQQYLEPYNSAKERIPEELKHFKDLTSDNPSQQKRCESMKKLNGLKLNELKETIDLHDEHQADRALELVKSNLGKKVMDEIREVVAAAKQEELQLLEKREQTAKSSATMANWVIGAGTISKLLHRGLEFLSGGSDLIQRCRGLI